MSTATEPMELREWWRQYTAARDITYRTRKSYEGSVNRMEAWYQSLPSHDGNLLTVATACEFYNEYVAFLCLRNRSTAASNRNSIRALLRAAAEEGLCTLPRKMRPVKVPEHRPRGFKPKELRALLSHATPLQKAAIYLAYDTGFRRGDLFLLTWDQVHRSQYGYQVAHAVSKTGRIEIRRLRLETVDALREVRHECDLLLPIIHRVRERKQVAVYPPSDPYDSSTRQGA